MILIPILKNICVNPPDVTSVSIVDDVWVTVGIRGQEKPLSRLYYDVAGAEAAFQQAVRMLSEYADMYGCGEGYGSKSELAEEERVSELGGSGTWTEDAHVYQIGNELLELRKIRAYRVVTGSPLHHIELLGIDGFRNYIRDLTGSQVDDLAAAISRSASARRRSLVEDGFVIVL
jgi:hypothetical protein